MRFITDTPDSVETAQLRESLRFCEFKGESHELKALSGAFPYEEGVIPFGTISLVEGVLEAKAGVRVQPIQVPYCLMTHDFLLRESRYITRSGKVFKQDNDSDVFIKNVSRYKPPLILGSSHQEFWEGDNQEYFVSEVIEILSEYRCFVFQSELLDVRCYLGDFTKTPDFDKIKAMINTYTNAPVAYTLDIAVTPNGTCILEVHHFYSVGFYGFSNGRLPYMVSQAYYELLRDTSKSHR